MVEEMEREAEELERAIQADPEISQMRAGDGLREKVFQSVGLQEDEVLSRLSEEDRQALLLGRAMQGKRRHRWKAVWKQIAVPAAALVLVLAVGITSVGGPKKFMEVIKQKVSGREMTKINTIDENAKDSGESREERAYQRIGDELGIEPVRIVAVPNGMKFLRAEIDKPLQTARMIYSMDDRIINYDIEGLFADNSIAVDMEDEKIDSYTMKIKGVKVKIEEYKISKSNESRFLARFEYNKVNYTLFATIEQDDFELILQNLHFF